MHISIKDRILIIFQYIIPHRMLNALAAKIANSKKPKLKNWLINAFIKKYNIDLGEYIIENPTEFISFNDFFTRKLKDGSREFNLSKDVISSPIDGSVSQIGDIKQNRLIQAKNHDYTLLQLTAGNEKFYHPFINGKFCTLYLSPKDYHCVHTPVDAKLVNSLYIPGKFFSVNEVSNECIPGIYTKNTRLLCLFETDFGPMCVIFVGAMIVGQISTQWEGVIDYTDQTKFKDHSKANINFNKGDLIGHFELGSTIILLFNNDISWNTNDFHTGTPIKLGQDLAKITKKIIKK